MARLTQPGCATTSRAATAACSTSSSRVDLDSDGDLDFLTTRGNSEPYDGLQWLEQTRDATPGPSFTAARETESPEVPLLTAP